MVNFERILCPVAGLHETDSGLHYAIQLARSYRARLFVLTCANKWPVNTAETDSAMRAAVKRAVENSLVMFQTGTTRLDWELNVVESKSPADSINKEAEQKKIDLIVMSAPRVPHMAVRLGSTAESVCRNAPCPVLVTRAERAEQSKASSDLRFKRLLVAYDFSNDSQLALRYGLSLAQEYQSDLHLLHVMTETRQDAAEFTWSPETKEGPYHIAARGLHQSVPSEAHLWCRVTHSVRAGRPYREIVSYAAKHNIDLICIGAHGQAFKLPTIFGSNTDRVLRTAPCPVFVARPLKPGVAESVN